MATRLLIFRFCFTGENGERNGRSHGFSVQFQNQGGGHHGAFCKGNTLSPHSSKDSQATEPQCAVCRLAGVLVFSGLLKVMALTF